MATTESRSGFRLPWAGDRRTEEPSDEVAAATEEVATPPGEATADGAPNPQAEMTDTADVRGGTDASASGADELRVANTSAVVDAGASAPATDRTDVTSSKSTDQDAPAPPSAATASPVAPSPVPATPATPAAPGRKPAKFLADLTKAMQAAAEAERQETLELFQLEAKSFVESIHARSSTEADDLRKRADGDVAAIRDWSKQEIARIREETEQKISARKDELSEEIDDHAARIEREIERVHALVERFEQDMAAFFETLLAETDPTRFAAMAASLPEPPSFDDLSRLPLPAPEPTDPVPAMAEATPSPELVPEVPMPGAAEAAPAMSAADREAAFAAIEAAARAAEGGEGPEATEESPPASTGDASGAPEQPSLVADDTVAEAADPRLAALGLADFAAAEAEASADLPTGDEEIPVISEPALEARLAELDPAETARAPETPTAQSSVVVVGLVSVASIASFKRHLARAAGVHSVGVSSGPDGEFVFTVAHDPGVEMRDVVPVLPGFGARVTDSGDGFVRVTAHDAESGV